MTEDQALEEAALEFERTPAVIGEALGLLGDPAISNGRHWIGGEAVNVAKLLADEDFTFDGAATTDLIAILWAGEERRAIGALYELRERVREALAPQIRERAAELLRAIERENEVAEEDAQIARLSDWEAELRRDAFGA